MEYEHEIYINPIDFKEFLWTLSIDKSAIMYVKRHISERRPMGDAILQVFIEYLRWYTVVGGVLLTPAYRRNTGYTAYKTPTGASSPITERRLEVCIGG